MGDLEVFGLPALLQSLADSSATGTFTQTAPVRPGYVKVTLTWTFQTLTSYPGIPSSWNLSQSEIMQMAPVTPSNFP